MKSTVKIGYDRSLESVACINIFKNQLPLSPDEEDPRDAMVEDFLFPRRRQGQVGVETLYTVTQEQVTPEGFFVQLFPVGDVRRFLFLRNELINSLKRMGKAFDENAIHNFFDGIESAKQENAPLSKEEQKEDELWTLVKVRAMCEQSLDPETFEKWIDVDTWLRKNRGIEPPAQY